MPVFEEIEACTTLNVEQCTITWTINNYSSIVKDVPGKYLSSPKFSLGNAAKRQFYLRLYPGGETEKSSKFISLFVYWNKTNNKQEFTCECKFSIITEVTGSIIHKRVFQAKYLKILQLILTSKIMN
uniref:MATH domain-containing protein n=1 Tax=Trichogramma kaykai TaxID=54128 RepID=A0ABD2X6L4_9HYME